MVDNRCEIGRDSLSMEECRHLEAEEAKNGLRNHMIECRPRFVEPSRGKNHFMRAFGLSSAVMVFSAELCRAASSMPGETSPGTFYTITHLHPVAYVILFLIFLLSLANLVSQGFISFSSWPLSPIVGILQQIWSISGKKMPAKKPRRAEAPDSGIVNRQLDDSVMAVRKLGKAPAGEMGVGVPTPLDGINHPMPKFGPRACETTGTPRVMEGSPEKKPPGQEFKFASAVDVPSPEEVERREKEQLVVSGVVKGPDGKGIDSVIVYLADSDGNRMGQSCRSMTDTGEFKVLINEPGKYVLSGYKRGYIMENAEPLVLPIESGKIEGLTLRMIPEGCTVQGRVVLEVGSDIVPDFEVKCVCGEGTFSRSGKTDATGEFRIPGVLINSKCYLEVRGVDGSLLTTTDPFETVQRKEVYREVTISTSKEAKNPDSKESWSEAHSDQLPSPGPTAAG